MLSRYRLYHRSKNPCCLPEEYFGIYAIKGAPRLEPEFSDEEGY
jgi:hypothetical protein